jgi:hypothetical protein
VLVKKLSENVRIRASLVSPIARIARTTWTARISRTPNARQMSQLLVDNLIIDEFTNIFAAQLINMSAPDLTHRVSI